jgi:uncharacterized beta barrel domain-containing protein DUF5777
MYKKFFLLFLFLSGMYTMANGQEEGMEDMLDSSIAPVTNEPAKIFIATRIIDGNSVANLDGGILDFRIDHRFGRLSEGSQNFYGLDDATTRIGFDYGITKWLMVGIGHNVFNKENDAFMKIALLRQRQNMPFSLNYAGETSIQTSPAPILPAGDTWLYRYRLYYMNQVLIARKFNDWLSIQIMPTILHYNVVDSSKFSNNTIAIGIGGRIKVTKHLALTGEYYYRLTNADMLYNGQPTYNVLSAGLEMESGGHVFQLVLTNAQGLTGRTFIGQTTDSWAKGQLHFGFNISRLFRIVKPRA